MDIEIHEASETSDQFAVYKDGRLVLEGEWLADYFTEILELVGIRIIKSEDFMLGGECGSDAAKTLAEIRAFQHTPEGERRAVNLEREAEALERQAQEIRRQAADARHRA